MKYIFKFILLFFLPLVGYAQNSLKIEQQKTSFFYLKSNLIFGGIENDLGKLEWLPITSNPLNQVSLTFHKKNQRLLQRGYVKNISLSDFRMKGAMSYYNDMIEGQYHSGLKFSFNDVWIKFKTKYYRTSIKIGYASLPYGHNPKVDPDFSFIPNIGGVDMGLARDLGVFYKTAFSKSMDFEFSFTSGGMINKPLFKLPLMGYEEKSLEINAPVFNNTWLTVARLGMASFNKNEIGLFTSFGNILQTNRKSKLRDVKRIGLEWLYKYYDDLHMTHQLLYGQDYNFGGQTDNKVIFQSVFECLWKKKWIVGLSQSTQFTNQDKYDALSKGKYTVSLGYAFTPHIRLKANSFYDVADFKKNNGKLGAYIQLVMGIGKRP